MKRVVFLLLFVLLCGCTEAHDLAMSSVISLSENERVIEERGGEAELQMLTKSFQKLSDQRVRLERKVLKRPFDYAFF